MKLNRRQLFAALAAAPAIAKVAPKDIVIDRARAQMKKDAALKRLSPCTLTAKQRELMDAPEREILFTGGRGAGMTYGSARWLEQKRSSLWMVENHAGCRYRQELFLPTGHSIRESDRTATRASGGKITMATPEMLDNLRGLHFDRIAFDIPADRLPYTVYATFRERHPHAQLLVATESPNGSGFWVCHHFYGAHPRCRVIQATAKDNPYLLSSLPDDVQKRYIEGLWV